MKLRAAFSGATAWPTIIGASLFWAWMDSAMFGTSLYAMSSDGSLVQDSFVVMMGVNVLTLLVLLVLVKMQHIDFDWHGRLAAASGIVGALGGVACVVASACGMLPVLLVGSVLIGISMGYMNMCWGRVSIAQGPQKALLHVSAAWTLGLPLNLIVAGFQPLAAGIYEIVLPLLSGLVFLLLSTMQDNETIRVEIDDGAGRGATEEGRSSEKAQPAEQGHAKHRIGHTLMGVDIRFLLIILVICGSFGMMCYFEILSPDVAFKQGTIDIVGMRNLTALLFFVIALTLLGKRMVILFRVSLSILAAGVVVMTVGLYVPQIEILSRLLVPVGYSSFDILVWTMVAFYAQDASTPANHAMVLAILAEQVGILGGALGGIVTLSAGATTTAVGVVLVVLDYLLLFSIITLVGYSMRLWPSDDMDVLGADSDHGPVMVDPLEAYHRLATDFGLTAREVDVLIPFCEGRSMPFIAESMCLSENTVKSHISHIYAKCGIHNKQELLDLIGTYR